MKGQHTIIDSPFRYGGLKHDYEKTCREWSEIDGKVIRKHNPFLRCYACGDYFHMCKVLSPDYPYAAMYKIPRGLNKGHYALRIICRKCAYKYNHGVIEMDGEIYHNICDFNEAEYKKTIKEKG